MNITAEIILAVVAVAGTFGTVISFFLNRNNVDASTMNTLSDTLNKLSIRVAELEEDGRRDNQQIQRLEHLLSICVIGLQTLTNQLNREDISPEWTPPAELDQFIYNFIQKEPKK